LIPVLAIKIGSYPEMRQPYFGFLCRVLEEICSTEEIFEAEHWEVVKDSISLGVSDTNQSIRTLAMRCDLLFFYKCLKQFKTIKHLILKVRL